MDCPALLSYGQGDAGMSINELTAYEIIQQQDLSGIKSHGILLRHKKSGARVLLMENDDEENF